MIATGDSQTNKFLIVTDAMGNSYCVYKISNVVDGKAYIGITSQGIRARWLGHLRAVKNGSTIRFHNAIRKHGSTAFVVEHIASARCYADLCELEQILVSQHQTLGSKGYNAKVGGIGGSFEGQVGAVRAPEIGAKISAARKGQKRTVEQIELHRIAITGRKQRPETIEKRASKQRGRKRPQSFLDKMTGRKNTPETIERMSVAAKGRKFSKETLEKMRAAALAREARKRSRAA